MEENLQILDAWSRGQGAWSIERRAEGRGQRAKRRKNRRL